MKLTATHRAAILFAPRHIEVGLRNPFRLGATTPLFFRVVFSFLPAVFVTGLFRAKFVMTGESYWGDLRLAAPNRGIANPTKNPAAQRFAIVGGVFSRLGNL